jgi:DNA (cytosine-5)-methyltransferase 1
MLVTRGLERVIGDLTALGYDTKWTVMGAADVGANHKRDRIWIVGKLADTSELFSNGGNDNAGVSLESKTQSEFGNNCRKEDVGKSKRKGLEGHRSQPRQEEVTKPRDTSALAHTSDQGDVWRQWQLGFAEQEHDSGGGKTNGGWEWWKAEPNVGRVADGVAARVDRLKAIGNGQVPLCAATAWRLLSEL